MQKFALKSKTVRAIMTALVLLLMNFLGVGEQQIGQTYDTIHDTRGKQTETAKDLGLLGAMLYALYGRSKAEGPLTWKKGGSDEKV